MAVSQSLSVLGKLNRSAKLLCAARRQKATHTTAKGEKVTFPLSSIRSPLVVFGCPVPSRYVGISALQIPASVQSADLFATVILTYLQNIKETWLILS